jgi:hypothetical protein
MAELIWGSQILSSGWAKRQRDLVDRVPQSTNASNEDEAKVKIEASAVLP